MSKNLSKGETIITLHADRPKIFAIDGMYTVPGIGNISDINFSKINNILMDVIESNKDFVNLRYLDLSNIEKVIYFNQIMPNFFKQSEVILTLISYKRLILEDIGSQNWETIEIRLKVFRSTLTRMQRVKCKRKLGTFLTNLTFELYSKLHS